MSFQPELGYAFKHGNAGGPQVHLPASVFTFFALIKCLDLILNIPGVRVAFVNWLPSVEFSRWKQESARATTENEVARSTLAEVTLKMDRMAVTHLTLLLLPLCVGFATKSLLMEKVPG